jgi:amidohydrolase
LVDDLTTRSAALAPDLARWRRHLHRHPELGFDVQRTAEFVSSRLKELRLEIHTGLGRTGVVGILRAEASRGPAVLLRADMDALPIQEVDGREYGSEVPGCMHACGHDGHTSMLLGAATLLHERRQDLTRDVVLCFQPAEEGGGGGGEMVADGVLELVETGSVYALHLWTPFEVGTAHVRSGPVMAAVDEFRARIVGSGGHGALPQACTDPIVAAAQVIGALQTIVSRNVDPIEPAVVTVGSVHAGTAPNIIPDDARIEGTMRSFSEDVRRCLRERVREIVDTVSAAAGCRVEYDLTEGYPAVINDPAAAEVARRAAREVFGEDAVHEQPPMATAEDFSYFLRERPGAFILLGAGNESRGITAAHHTPRFDIDESALQHGAELLARLALSG